MLQLYVVSSLILLVFAIISIIFYSKLKKLSQNKKSEKNFLLFVLSLIIISSVTSFILLNYYAYEVDQTVDMKIQTNNTLVP